MFNATNGENLPPCDRDVQRKGKVVVVSLFGKDITELLVRELQALGLRCDWHFHRNRIVVKAIGDTERAKRHWWDTIAKHKLDSHWRG